LGVWTTFWTSLAALRIHSPRNPLVHVDEVNLSGETSIENQKIPKGQNASAPFACWVTATFNADDYIDEVYYNGKDVQCEVEGVNESVSTLKTFKFQPVSGAVLAIAANDNESGKSAAFYISFKSDNPDWNFQLSVRNVQERNVKSFGTEGSAPMGSMRRPIDSNPPYEWFENWFDDSSWDFPGPATCNIWPNRHHMPGLWHGQSTFTFYRIKDPVCSNYKTSAPPPFMQEREGMVHLQLKTLRDDRYFIQIEANKTVDQVKQAVEIQHELQVRELITNSRRLRGHEIVCELTNAELEIITIIED